MDEKIKEKQALTNDVQIGTSFEAFCKTIETLRAPGGCPWDAKQTHESLQACMTEEAAEVNAAIRIYKQTNDDTNLCEELGDVLLQVVMHSQIAKEENRFTMADVINNIQEKMVRRHPHVFSDVTVTSTQEVLKNWEEIKKKEKEKTTKVSHPLRDIPLEIPVLLRASKVLKKIQKSHQEEPSYEKVIEQIKENLSEMEKQKKSEYSQKEEKFKTNEEIFGETLLEMLKLAICFDINANQALEDVLEQKIQSVESSKNIL